MPERGGLAKIYVDGVTVTGKGTKQSPLSSTGGGSAELSKTLDYDNDSLSLVTSSAGTKEMVYENGILVGIIGTGIYKSKDFVYAQGNLVAINIL